jgi:RNA polymerase sigma-70 factor (ECF subfamily)
MTVIPCKHGIIDLSCANFNEIFKNSQYSGAICVYTGEKTFNLNGGERRVGQLDGKMQDAAIIELYWNRDESAITESDRHYGTYCRRIANNILSNREDTEECINDTWYRSWDNMPPQRPASLAAFFGRIVRNLSISRYRANRAKKRFDGITVLLSELEDCVPSRESVSQTVEGKLLSDTIDNWLTQLTKDDRVLFIRRYWFGDAVQDLAAECGCTQNQMAQRMLRLRKGLKTVLEQEAIDL